MSLLPNKKNRVKATGSLWPVTALMLILALILPVSGIAAEEFAEADSSGWSRKQKVAVLNTATAAVILGWGFMNWDYGERSPHMKNEGWFSQGTSEGGADKFGHLFTSFALTHGCAALYEQWGYERNKAGLYGSLSSLMVTSIMEFGDSFSSYGFSYEDQVMNIAGAATGYLLFLNPDLDRLLDLRWEYAPSFNHFEGDFVTDYEHSRYLLAVKAEGIDAITNKWLKALELHVGYYARGYGDFKPDLSDERRRNLYVGIGINMTRLVKPLMEFPLFDYLQLPYTYIPVRKTLDH